MEGSTVRFCPDCGHRTETIVLEEKERRWCPQCSRPYFLNPRLAAGVILHWAGQVLLGRRTVEPGRGKWSFPAGYVDQGETVEDAAVREVLEETGLTVRLTGLVGLYSETGNPVVLAVYMGSVEGGTLYPGSDIAEVGWFPLGNLPPLAFARDHHIFTDWRWLYHDRSQRG